jgi:hypothetical protein
MLVESIHSLWTNPSEDELRRKFELLQSQVSRNKGNLDYMSFTKDLADVLPKRITPYDLPVVMPPGKFSHGTTFVPSGGGRHGSGTNGNFTPPNNFYLGEDGHLYQVGAGGGGSDKDLGLVTGEGVAPYNPLLVVISGHLWYFDDAHPSGVDLAQVAGNDGADGVDGKDGAQGPPGTDGADGESVAKADVMPSLYNWAQVIMNFLFLNFQQDVMLKLENKFRVMITNLIYELTMVPKYKKPTNGINGQDGVDGVTPLLRTESVDDSVYLQVSYDDGDTWETISDDLAGQDGQPGKDGVDAKNPIFDFSGYQLGYKFNPGDSLTLIGPSLRGATGATGATGAKGAKGDKGDKGDTGDAGATVKYYYLYCPN